MTAFLARRARLAVALAGVVGVVLLAVLPPSLPAYVVIVLTECLIYAMAAGSLDLLIGYTGLASLGHAAFFAVGAYTTALLATRSRVSFAAALTASVLLAAAASAAVGVLILRASGIYFMMITLSVSMCAWGLAYRWVSLTGGDTGIVSIPRPRLGLVTGGLEFYYATFVLFLVCLTLYLLLDVGETLAIASRPREDGWTVEKIYELFPPLRARSRHPGNQLSGGEQQMLAIGRGLMMNPSTLMLDEPTEGLSPLYVETVGQAIRTLQSRGIAMLLVEQNLKFALRYSDHVHIMNRGSIVYSSSPRALTGDDEARARYLGV